MESPIDQKYRRLLEIRLKGYEECLNQRYIAKYFCPECQADNSKVKKKQKKGAIFWHPKSNSWRFYCVNNKCSINHGLSMYNFMDLVNQELARKYQLERWHSGTTGWGHDCPNPSVEINIIQSSHLLQNPHIGTKNPGFCVQPYE